MPPLRGDSSPEEVQSTMQKVSSLEDIETLGAPVFALCDRYGADSLSLGVDFDAQCYEAVFAVIDGKPLEQVRACVDIPPTHPASDHIDAALQDVVADYRRGRQN